MKRSLFTRKSLNFLLAITVLTLTVAGVAFSQALAITIIGPGPDNNLQVHQLIEITIDANNIIRTNVINTSIDCN